MFGLNLLYIFSIGLLICFGGAFFTTELYLPKILKWKANKLFTQSQVYLDEQINNIGGLLDDGVQKAKIAHLLDPENQLHLVNFLRLQYRTSPAKAIMGWSSAIHNQDEPALREELLEKSFEVLRNSDFPPHERKIGAEVAYREIERSRQDVSWASNPENQLKYCELLAETGQQDQAFKMTIELVDQFPEFPEAIFLLARISAHLEDDSYLLIIAKGLANIATQKNDNGIQAIRHMTLLHLLYPLSSASLEKCIELLSLNPKAKPIDFMRIHALRYGISTDLNLKDQIISSCANLFDLDSHNDLLIFARWLARLGNFKSLVDYLPAHTANLNDELFQLRMNALVRVGDFERIHTEIANAPLISSKWKLVIEAQSYTMTGHYEDAIKLLDQLILVIEKDPREVVLVCDYLEKSQDIHGLCHLLEYFSDKPIHSKFALSKLIHYRAGSAYSEELVKWLKKLAEISPKDVTLEIAVLYLDLIDTQLVSPSRRLDNLIKEADRLTNKTNLQQARICLALAHLRNNSPDMALVALGPPQNWRSWLDSRPAWSFIASHIYQLNHDTEKSMLLSQNFDSSKLDFAERESFKILFPSFF
jgi:hypothetical protein